MTLIVKHQSQYVKLLNWWPCNQLMIEFNSHLVQSIHIQFSKFTFISINSHSIQVSSFQLKIKRLSSSQSNIQLKNNYERRVHVLGMQEKTKRQIGTSAKEGILVDTPHCVCTTKCMERNQSLHWLFYLAYLNCLEYIGIVSISLTCY